MIQQEKSSINFPELMDRLLSLLTEKEQNIIARRFSLKNNNKETLEKIGQSYSITRERVRQIEAVAIKKLARISMDPAMRAIHDMAYDILVSHGKVMSEDLLVSEMLKHMENTQNINVNSMKLAMRVSDRLIKQEKNQFFRPFWRTKDVSIAEIRDVVKAVKKHLKPQTSVVPLNSIVTTLEAKFNAQLIASVMHIDWEFMQKKEQWGLTTCRFINPKSIKDKVIITLREHGKPLHFTDIINQTLKSFTGKKSVTSQAIHNELIRHKEFALVGRGLYGLSEWGLPSGTVCDLIRDVLIENKEPMKRQDIIKNVQEKRDIRTGTISLNLQKYDFFRRVGRAVYEYVPSMDKRRRNLKAIRQENEE